MSGLGAERVHAWGAAPGNTWQSEFPRQNSNDDGFERTSPVTAFAPNGYGRFRHDRECLGLNRRLVRAEGRCRCEGLLRPANPPTRPEAASHDPCQPNIKIPRKVIKGSSHLCVPNYCRRYRPAARHPEPVDTSTSHLGFAASGAANKK